MTLSDVPPKTPEELAYDAAARAYDAAYNTWLAAKRLYKQETNEHTGHLVDVAADKLIAARDEFQRHCDAARHRNRLLTWKISYE